jgi:putative heme degradation protein
MTNDHWEMIQEAFRLKAKEPTVVGEMQVHPAAFLERLRKDWALLSDKKKLAAFLKKEKLAELKATRNAAKAAAADATAQIKQLGG